MPQKERAEPARPVRDRRWSDSQSIGPERWNSNPRPSTDLTTVTEAFLSCDQSTWQVKGLQQIHLGSWRQAIADRSVVSMVQGSTSRNKPVGSVDLDCTFSLVMEAEGVGFEPTDRRNLSTVFKTVPINHSGTPPEAQTKDR